MRKWAIAAVVVLGALLATPGHAAEVRYGTLVLQADGGFKPQLLPKHAFAPIHFKGHGDIKTTDGSVPPPLRHVKLEFDHDGRVTTAGLGICQPGSIEGATPKQARHRCSGEIVGTGHLGAAVPLPLLGRVDMRSPLTLFNGPRRDGDPTVILHAQAPFPVSETYVVVIKIERRSGTYGYRTEFDVPPIAGGIGAITHLDAKVGLTYRAGGHERSYVSARCSDYVLQTQGYFFFTEDIVIYGSAFKACRPKE